MIYQYVSRSKLTDKDLTKVRKAANIYAIKRNLTSLAQLT
jgi:hypothetical protein